MLTPTQLDLLRTSNHSVPLLPGMRVLGQVVGTDSDAVQLDTGHRGRTTISRADLSLGTLLGTTREGLETPRRTPYHVMRGDVTELVVRETRTPFRTPWLELPHRDTRDLYKAVFAALQLAHAEKRVVEGRVLNAVSGGWAVGFGGCVGLLPASRAALATTRALGALRPFRIAKISGKPWQHNIVVLDASLSSGCGGK